MRAKLSTILTWLGQLPTRVDGIPKPCNAFAAFGRDGTMDTQDLPGHAKIESPSLQLVTAIQRATHVLGVHLESVLGDLKLSQGEIHVLSLLAESGAASVTELQRGVRHRPSTLTGILDRLISKGMAQRQINEADRRFNLIALTPQGRVAADRVRHEMSTLERRLLRNRQTSELELLRQILGEISAAL
jgi:MarR family transcriptional regulator, organic hydroperoxide resistance regulator